MNEVTVVDLFAGSGGFSVGAHRVIGERVIGVELDADACATQQAAGMTVLRGDVAKMDPGLIRWDGRLHLHCSPPCTTFSFAGKGRGRGHVDRLKVIIRDLLVCGESDPGLAEGIDATSLLVTEPARWIGRLMPDSISFEQMKAVLPLWETYADLLESIHGYSVWTGLLHAEQFGVPQTRTRAWLGASKHRVTGPPAPDPLEVSHSHAVPA